MNVFTKARDMIFGKNQRLEPEPMKEISEAVQRNEQASVKAIRAAEEYHFTKMVNELTGRMK